MMKLLVFEKRKEFMIDFVRYHNVPKNGSLIGFCSFRYNQEFNFNEIPVHKRMEPEGNILIRLRYPKNIFPFNRKVQQEIDLDINSYILANYREDIK